MSRKIKNNYNAEYIVILCEIKVLLMKIKLIAILLMLVMMAFLPFAAAKYATESESANVMATADNAPKNNNENEKNISSEDNVLCGLVSALCEKDYSSETIKAISILLNNDYSLEPDKFDLSNPDTCLYVENADNDIKEIYAEIEKAVSSSKNLLIYYNDKNVFIPYSKISNGNTVSDENYNYISPVASPWDCFSDYLDRNAECIGVSIEGIDYLCKNGMSAEEALSWYLPECEIK